MGLIKKLQAELVDIIEWVDDSRHTLIWRFPRYHNQIKQGAQLIVRPGQSAVFVHNGKIADIFSPGQYTLDTGNLPILSTLAGWYHGFDSAFKSEVYFVSTRQITDLKWGTPNPVMVRDPDFGPIRVRAFGTYTLKAQDPKTLLTELIGTDAVFEAEEITELLRAIISQVFADVIAKSEIAVLDFASHYVDLSDAVRRAVIERIDDEYRFCGTSPRMARLRAPSRPASSARRSRRGASARTRSYGPPGWEVGRRRGAPRNSWGSFRLPLHHRKSARHGTRPSRGSPCGAGGSGLLD